MEQEFIFLEAIRYFAEYHLNNFFHGDIKPANLLMKKGSRSFEITSDAGSLLYLGKD